LLEDSIDIYAKNSSYSITNSSYSFTKAEESSVVRAKGRSIRCPIADKLGLCLWACFEPNTIASHAAYAMNLLYQTAGRNPWNCDFSQTATLSSNNPSKFPNTKPSSIPMLVFLPVSTLGQLIENTTFSYSMGDQLL